MSRFENQSDSWQLLVALMTYFASPPQILIYGLDTIGGKPMYFLCQHEQRIITKIRPSFAGFLYADSCPAWRRPDIRSASDQDETFVTGDSSYVRLSSKAVE